MLRIGDFAKIARVSVKTLHHYDEIGLLKPELTQTGSGYRYYSIDQLPRLNRILVLKDLGFTLNQIRAILNENLSSVEIRGMLRLKEAELATHIQEQQERLERVKARLHQIEREDMPRNYDILIKPVEALPIVSARAVIPVTSEAFRQCFDLASEVYRWITDAGGKVGNNWLSLYHEVTLDGQNERMDFEMAVEVEPARLTKAAPAENGRVRAYELPGCETMACLLHQGDYNGLWDASIGLTAWIESRGYRSAGPYRCLYLHMAHQGETPLTELQIPVQPGN